MSYSCMPNIKSIVSFHNRHIMKSIPPESDKSCNCITKSKCPLNQQCLVNNIVYQATLYPGTPDGIEKVYFGVSETAFKLRYANHTKSFKIEKYKNDTELSKEVWKLKENGVNPTIKWKILKRCRSYNPTIKRCNLCLYEKYFIISYTYDNLLNKRNELVANGIS